MATFSHRSFAGGEIAPTLHARVDTEKYQTGAAEIENFIVQKHGGLNRRPGSKFAGRSKFTSYKVRFQPYVVNESDSYMLEIGHRHTRVLKHGEYLMVPNGPSVSGVADNGTITYSAGMYAYAGQRYRVTGAKGVTNLNYTELQLGVKRDGETTAWFKRMDPEWNPDSTHKFTITEVASGGYAVGATVDVTATGNTDLFHSTWVGKRIWFGTAASPVTYIEVDSVTSSSVVRGTVKLEDVPAGYQNTATANFRYPSLTRWTPSGAYTSGGTLETFVEILTPYLGTDLEGLRFSQNDQWLIMTHAKYPPYQLRQQPGRSGGKYWSLEKMISNGRIPGTNDRTGTYNKVRPPSYWPGSVSFIQCDGYRNSNWLPPWHSKFVEDRRSDGENDGETVQYAVTCVSPDGVESCPSYSARIIQPQENVTGISYGGNCAAGEALRNPSGFKVSWTGSAGKTNFKTDRIAAQVTIGPYANKLSSGDSFVIYGKDFYGESVKETLSVAAQLAESEYAHDSTNPTNPLRSETYFSSVDRIISKEAQPNSNSVKVGYGKYNLDNNIIEWKRTPFCLDEHGNRVDIQTLLGESRANAPKETYRIYKSTGGLFGYIGETAQFKSITSRSPGINNNATFWFLDTGLEPDYSLTPPIPRNPFPESSSSSSVANFRTVPACSTHYQQRRVLAGTRDRPERVWLSRVGEPYNFDDRDELLDNDSFWFDISSDKVERILHLAQLERILVFTQSGEHVIMGDGAGKVTPSTINVQKRSSYGSGDLPPIIVGPVALFYQPRGTVIRDVTNIMATSGYQGNDLTVFAGHMFRNRQINSWAYQQDPDSVVWCTVNGTELLGMTYLKEHQIFAWHRHTFQGGTIDACGTVSEGTGENRRDYLYVSVKRTLNGVTKRYTERLVANASDQWRDWNFTDSARTYDGWNTGSTTMTVSEYSGGGFSSGAEVTVTASASTFTSDMVGGRIYFGAEDDGDGNSDVDFYVNIDTYSSGTVIRGTVSADVPSAYQDEAVTTWGRAIHEMDDLYHLEGENVSILGDGIVLASPNNSDFATVTVADGKVSLSTPAVRVKVGLPMSSDLLTLDIDVVQGESLADRNKLVSRCNFYLDNSRGGFVGPAKPTTAQGTLYNLREFDYYQAQDYQDTTVPYTGLLRVLMSPDWSRGGRVFVRQVDPLPMNILAIHPQISPTRRNPGGR